MFDIGGWEFLVIIVIAIVVIGPKDLPGTIRTVTGWIRRARELARDFQSGLDDLAREAEIDNVRNEIQSGLGLDDMREAGHSVRREVEHSIDPGGEIAGSFKSDPMSDPYLEDDEDPEPPRKDIAASDLQSAEADRPVARDSSAPPPEDAPAASDEEPAGAAKKA